MDDLRLIKCLSVGDSGVGKTCLLHTYLHSKFPESAVPTVFDNYNKITEFGAHTVKLSLWDTAGQPDYDRLRPLAYPDADIFLVYFSLVNRISMDNVLSKWIPEVQHYCPKVQVLLVGTKSDLRNWNKHTGDKILTSEGQKVADFINETSSVTCRGFMECSARYNIGVNQVFFRVIDSVLNPVKKKSKPNFRFNCVLL